MSYDEIIDIAFKDQNHCDDNDELIGNDHGGKGSYSDEEIGYFETAMKWFKQQEDCDAV